MTKRRIQYKHTVTCLCVCVCVFVHSPFEITGKRKWRNAGEHLLIAKSLGEAFDNDASGRCSSSSISADGASINAACRLNFAPKLKEFLHVVSANNINYYFSIYKTKKKQQEKLMWISLLSQALRPLHICLYVYRCICFPSRWKSHTHLMREPIWMYFSIF